MRLNFMLQLVLQAGAYSVVKSSIEQSTVSAVAGAAFSFELQVKDAYSNRLQEDITATEGANIFVVPVGGPSWSGSIQYTGSGRYQLGTTLNTAGT